MSAKRPKASWRDRRIAAPGPLDPNEWVQQLPPKAPPSPSPRVAALQKIAERAAGVAS